jgi:hypothetical protein
MILEREKPLEKAVTIKGKGKVVSALNSALRHEYIWGNSALDEGK